MAPSTSTAERGSGTTGSLPRPVRAAAFWSAVLLPFCAFALLASGLETTTEYLFFLSVVAANVAALVIGHSYGTK